VRRGWRPMCRMHLYRSGRWFRNQSKYNSIRSRNILTEGILGSGCRGRERSAPMSRLTTISPALSQLSPSPDARRS
jgi:hypothetical protein